MSARRITAAAALLAALILAAAAPARAISTAAIISSAASPSCLQWRPIGVCIWLTCTPAGCTTKTSVKVKHYIPDLVVSAYEVTGANPWRAVAPLAPPNPLSLGGGLHTEGKTSIHTNLRFKNVDAIGDPAVATFAAAANVGYTCASAAKPFIPYYLSVDDPLAWRAGIPEAAYPESLIPGLREIGSPGNIWGHVYPREGTVIQANDYKAAAVTAERVADIVTRQGQPHVYTPEVGQRRPGYWPPPPKVEGKPKTGQWQRLQPDPSTSCVVFPDRGPAASFAGDVAPDGNYVWVLWRPYECCKRRGETLIFSTPDPP